MNYENVQINRDVNLCRLMSIVITTATVYVEFEIHCFSKFIGLSVRTDMLMLIFVVWRG